MLDKHQNEDEASTLTMYAGPGTILMIQHFVSITLKEMYSVIYSNI